MKRLLMSILTMVMVIGLVGGGYFAYFRDTETNSDNTFTAGILDLAIDCFTGITVPSNSPVISPNIDPAVDDPPKIFDSLLPNNLAPGDKGQTTISLHLKKDSINADLWMQVINLVPFDAHIDTIHPPFHVAPDADISDNILIKVWLDTIHNNSLDGTETVVCSTNLRDLVDNVGKFAVAYNVAAEDTRYVGWSWEVPAELGNEYQGDSCTFDIVFGADQVTTYTLTTSGDGNGSVIPPGGAYAPNTEVMLTPDPDPGYRFDHWSIDYSGTANPGSVTMNGPKSVQANFVQEEYSLTIDKVGTGTGTVTPTPNNSHYHYNDVVALGAAADPGSIFNGWSVNVVSDQVTITGNTLVTATFDLDTYMVTASIAPPAAQTAGCTVSGDGSKYFGDAVSLAANAVSGWVFTGWSGSYTSSANPLNFNMPSNAVAVTANFESAVVTETLYSTGDSFISALNNYSNDETNDNFGTQNTMRIAGGSVDPNNYADRYSLVQFTLGSLPPGKVVESATLRLFTNASDFLQGGPVSAHRITSSWTETGVTWDNQPSVNSTPTISESVASASSWYEWDVTSDVMAFHSGTTNRGWELRRNTSSGESFYFQTRENTNVPQLVITYAPAVSLATNVGTGGSSITLSPIGGSYAYGTSVQVTAVPTAGYAFSSWSGDLGGSINPTTITMDGNKSITANFVQQEYTLTINTTGSGSVARLPNQPTYHYGDVVQLTATPAEYWSFGNWSGGATGSVNPVNVTINGNTTVGATFTPGVTVTLSSNRDTYINSSAGGTNYGDLTTMIVGNVNSYRGLVGFDLSSIPSGMVITSAELRLNRSGGDQRTVNVYRTTGSWVESTVTWNSRPDYFGTAIDSTDTVSGWNTWEVTSDAQGFYQGTLVNNGWLVTRASGSITNTFDTRESSNDPQLVITYAPGKVLTISAGTGGTITTPGSGTYTYASGTDASIIASASTGYAFLNWTGDAVANANAASTTITMDGNKTVMANFYDATAPAGSLNINGGAASTGSTSVTLNLAATDGVGVTGYRVADGSDASGASTIAIASTTSYGASVAWTLPSGEGTKTVAVQYRDAAGNWSPNYTDTIVLDSSAPMTASVTTPTNGSAYTTVPATFSGSAADNSGGVGLNSNSTTFTLQRSSDSQYWTGSAWQVAVANLATTHSSTTGNTAAGWTDSVSLPTTWATGTYTVQATATDRAGNAFSGTAVSFTVTNPVPTTTNISPTGKTVGDVQFTLTVNGTNFVSTSVVRSNGSDRTTTYVSATQLTAVIPAADLAAAGTRSITVFNPSPGGGTSNAQTLTVANRSAWFQPASNVGDPDVVNENYAYVSDGNRVIFDSQDDIVVYYTFGSVVPVGSTIVGIEVSLEGQRDSGRTWDISLSYDGSSGSPHWTSAINAGSTFGGADSTVVIGGPANNWGYGSWTPTIINSNNFRIRVDATSNPGGGDVILLDQILVRVYYLP